MMRRTLSLLLLLLTAATPLFAGPAGEDEPVLLSLDDAIRYALQHHIAIKNARVDVALQRAKNKEITGIALPQINGKDEFTYYPSPIKSFVPAQFFDPNAKEGDFAPVTFTPKFGNTASISGSQILFDGSVIVALQARNTLIQLSELGVRASENDVRYNVQKAYYSMVVAQKQFEILQSTIATSRDVVNDLSILRKEGMVEKIEVDRSAVQLNNLLTDSLRIASLLEVSQQFLKYNMGMPLSREVVLSDTALSSQIEELGEALETTYDYGLRTDYQQLQIAMRLEQYNLKRYKYKALPSVALFGTAAYTYSSNRLNEVLTPGNYLFYGLTGLQINVPIFTGFQRKYQVVQSKLNIEKLQNNMELLSQSIDFQSASYRTTLRNALLSVESQERNLALANSVLDLARKKYKAGVGSNLEVSQAQVELSRAQGGYFQSLLDVVNARTDLAKATGTLSPQVEVNINTRSGAADNDRSGSSPSSNPGNISNPGKPAEPDTNDDTE